MTLRELRAKCRALCGLPEPELPAPNLPPAVNWEQWVVDDAVLSMRNQYPVYGDGLRAVPADEMERRQREDLIAIGRERATRAPLDPLDPLRHPRVR